MFIIAEVTQNDIDEGIPFKITKCPWAFALRRCFKRKVYVYGDTYTLHGLQQFQADLPVRVKHWIRRFDECKSVKPMKAKIELPEEFRKAYFFD